MHSCTADTYTDVERISRSCRGGVCVDVDAVRWDAGIAFPPNIPVCRYPFRADWDCHYRQSCRCDSLRFAHSSDFRVGRRHLHHNHVYSCKQASKHIACLLACLHSCIACNKKSFASNIAARGPLAGVLLSRVHDVRIRYFAAANRDGQKGAWICNGQGERIDHCLGLPRGGHAFSREEQGDGGHVNCLHLPHGRRTYQTHPGF